MNIWGEKLTFFLFPEADRLLPALGSLHNCVLFWNVLLPAFPMAGSFSSFRLHCHYLRGIFFDAQSRGDSSQLSTKLSYLKFPEMINIWIFSCLFAYFLSPQGSRNMVCFVQHHSLSPWHSAWHTVAHRRCSINICRMNELRFQIHRLFTREWSSSSSWWDSKHLLVSKKWVSPLHFHLHEFALTAQRLTHSGYQRKNTVFSEFHQIKKKRRIWGTVQGTELLWVYWDTQHKLQD